MVSYAEIMSQIHQKKYSPVYFLQGEEVFFIDNVISHIEDHALDESQKNLNQIIVYGKDTSLTDVIGDARKYPMMGDRQVVIVKEAQDLKGWNRDDQQALLSAYLENQSVSTILVFGYKYKKIEKRTKLGKILEKRTVFLNAKKLYDHEIHGWIQSYCDTKNVAIERDAVMMLAENIGNHLQRLANEIDKLIVSLTEKRSISGQMVHKYVGISKDYNIFELQKALGTRNPPKVYKIINYFSNNPSNNPLTLTIYSLFSYFSKLLLLHSSTDQSERALAGLIGVNPYFVKEYLVASRHYSIGKVIENIKHLDTADLESKGIDSDTKKDDAVLTELVYKLMN